MSDFDFNLLAEIAESAPVAGGNFNYTNYGKTWMDNLQVSKYNQTTSKYEKRPYTGGQIGEGEVLEFQLHQEIEKKDGETFNKTWYVQVKENGKRTKTDWGTYIKPSITKTFKSLGEFFKAMNKGTYAAVEDYDTGRDREDKNGKIDEQTGEVKKYPVTAPRFVEIFANKKACDEAKKAKFAKDALPEGAVPLSVVNTFKATVEALGSVNEAKSQFALEFEGYPIEDVIRESGLA